MLLYRRTADEQIGKVSYYKMASVRHTFFCNQGGRRQKNHHRL